jgi:ribosome-binding ATPase YchF (GTP1/OBG family)
MMIIYAYSGNNSPGYMELDPPEADWAEAPPPTDDADSDIHSQARLETIVGDLAANLSSIKLQARGQADKLSSLEHTAQQIQFYLEENEKNDVMERHQSDGHDQEKWAELKQLSAELLRMIQAQHARIGANMVKKEASKKRFESVLEDLNDRSDALVASYAKLEQKRREGDLTAWATFQWLSAMLIPASAVLAYIVYRRRLPKPT